jgi:drug/metabolite transporter (DMT)-like permease
VALGMILISVNDALIKLTSESLGVGQILFLRGSMAVVVFSALILSTGRPLLPRSLFNRWNLIRAGCETAATLCFVTGLSLLPIATAATLVWTAPIFLTIMAALVMKERVARRRWSAVVAGFAGVVLVTKPWQMEVSWILLLPLLAAVMVAIRDIVTRKVGTGLHSLYIVLPTLVSVTLAGAVLAIFDWKPVTASHLIALSTSAALLCIGFYCHISAVRLGDLSFIAPFFYVGIIMSIIWGILIWSEYPGREMYVGVFLIVGSGLYILHRNQIKQSDGD